VIKIQSVVDFREPMMGNGKVQKAIIISDDRDLTSIMQYALNSYGIEVTCFGNVTEAIENSIVEKLDIIIADYATTGVHGLELTQRLRELYPMAIIIGLSGSDMEVDSLRAGATDFLRKPFVPYRLAMMIDGGDMLS
jgi:DNA-binding response OmpR family regulator